MKPIRRILVGIKDPGARSLPAVEKAAQLAKAAGAELALFHAIAVTVPTEPYLYAEGGFAKHERQVRQRHLDALEKLAARLRRKHRKLKVRVDADWDYPVHEAIVRQARKYQGGPGGGGGPCGPPARTLAAAADGLGVAAHLAGAGIDREVHPGLESPSPARRDRPGARLREAGRSRRRDPEGGHAAGGRAARFLARDARLPIRFRAARRLTSAESAQVVEGIMAATETEASQAFDRALRKSRIPRSRRHLVRGAPGEAVPRTARALRADIAVMGAISRSALKRIAIGNTAERVLGDLPCDVLVVKPARFVTRVSRTRRGVRYTVSTEVPMPF